jgi:hypothetical protein
MNPDQQANKPRGGLLGLFDKAMKTDEDTGLSPLQNFAAALDPLILKDLRGGEGIRQQGVQRAATMSKNKTVDMLRQQGRNDLADAVMNRTIGAKEAFSVMQSEAAADKAFQRQKDLAAFTAGLKAPAAPKLYSEFAKLNADLQAGNISKDQYNASVQSFLNKNKMSIRTTPDGGFEFVQGESAGKPMTEAQSKNIGFYKRSQDALKLFDPVADSLVDSFAALAEMDPTGVTRYLQSDEYQQAQVLGKDFLAPILRKDTGAAVTPSEWVFYKAIYIPEVGDNPAKLAEKKAARERAVEAMRIGLEPSQIVKLEGVDPATAPGLKPNGETKIDLKFNPATGELEPV